jgi:hypothetical protein
VGSIVVIFALNAVVWWVALVAHELGHAAVGLTRTEGLVVVRAGSRSPQWRRRFGRLKLELGPVPLPFERADGMAYLYASVGRATAVMLAVAGPVAGSAAAALFILLGSRFQLVSLQIIGCVVLLSHIANLLPFRLRGVTSDGAHLVEALSSHPGSLYEADEQLDAVVSRWLVLATDFRGAFGARDRDLFGRLNSKLRRAKLERDDEALATHWLTFAGWCWRKAERGDTTPIRGSVLDARHHATRAGLTRADIIAAAAGELVRQRTDLEAGSPTPDSLQRGLERAHANPRCREAPDGKARVAFCLGVAMHDVATIAG